MTGAARGGGAAGDRCITGWQLALLVVTSLAIEDSTSLNHELAGMLGRDMWLPGLTAGALAVPAVYCLLALARRHPGRSLFGILKTLLGPLAYPLGIAYTALFLLDAGMAARQYGAVARVLGFTQVTPEWAFVAPLVALAIYSNLAGLDVLARINSAILLFADVPLGVLLTVLSLNHQRFERIMPVLADGLAPLASGTRLMVGGFGVFILLLVYLPLAEDRADADRAAVWSIPFVVVMALGHALGPVLTFGGSVRDLTWPVYSQTRAIEVGRFLQDLDVFVVLFWTHGLWMETALFLNAAARTSTELFGLKDHRAFITALGGVIAVLALKLTPEQASAFRLQRFVIGDLFLGFGVGLPLVLLAWSLLREGRQHSRAAVPPPTPEL